MAAETVAMGTPGRLPADDDRAEVDVDRYREADAQLRHRIGQLIEELLREAEAHRHSDLQIDRFYSMTRTALWSVATRLRDLLRGC